MNNVTYQILFKTILNQPSTRRFRLVVAYDFHLAALFRIFAIKLKALFFLMES